MSESIDDLSIEYIEDDIVVLKQLEKEVLTRGNWTTIMFLFQEWDKKTESYGPQKVSIRRYQKRNGVYRQQSKFTISNAKQAKNIINVLTNWFGSDPEFKSGDTSKE